MQKPPKYIYLFAVLAMLFWGMSFIWTSVVFKYYQPVTTIFLRLVISSLILFITFAIAKKLEKIKREHLNLFMLSALFNPFLYFLGENFGLKFSSPAVTAVVIATIPVFTPLFAYFLIKEKIRLINKIGILVSFLGVVVMIINPDLTLNACPLGIFLLILAVISAILYSIIVKKLTKNYSAFSIITYQNMLGVIYFLPVFLLFDYEHFITVKPEWEAIRSLIYLAVFASSAAFILFVIVVKHIGVSKANVYSNIIPVITAIASYYMLSEFFSWNKIIGIIIVICGVAITQINRK